VRSRYEVGRFDTHRDNDATVDAAVTPATSSHARNAPM
jgi:hypothetical protein